MTRPQTRKAPTKQSSMGICTIPISPSKAQVRREVGDVKKGLVTPGPATFGGPAVTQKYKVHHIAPFSKKKFKKIFPQRGPAKCLEDPAKKFPRAPLWLSTGLARHDLKSALLAD